MTDALFPSLGHPAAFGPAGPAIRSGLQELLHLINDALRSSGTPAGGLIARQAVTESVAPHTPRLGGRAARASVDESRPRPSPHPRAPEGADSDGPEDVEETHAETWRLVRLAQGGDGEAFGLLYDRYVDSIYRFIYFRVNDRALAEDFTSETFLRALRRIGTISYQGRDIGAWFMTIARNIVLDHVKSARHRLETPTADTIEGKEHNPSTETAVLESLQTERLMQAIGELGDEQRECVMLRFIQGLSVSETAQIMGKNDGAIKALQHRAVRKLATIIGTDLQ